MPVARALRRRWPGHGLFHHGDGRRLDGGGFGPWSRCDAAELDRPISSVMMAARRSCDRRTDRIMDMRAVSRWVRRRGRYQSGAARCADRPIRRAAFRLSRSAASRAAASSRDIRTSASSCNQNRCGSCGGDGCGACGGSGCWASWRFGSRSGHRVAAFVAARAAVTAWPVGTGLVLAWEARLVGGLFHQAQGDLVRGTRRAGSPDSRLCALRRLDAIAPRFLRIRPHESQRSLSEREHGSGRVIHRRNRVWLATRLS